MSNRKSVSSRVACPAYIDEKVGPVGSSRPLTLAEFDAAWPWLESRIVSPTLERYINRGTNYLAGPARAAAGKTGEHPIASTGLVRMRLREETPDLIVEVFQRLRAVAESPRGISSSRAALQRLTDLVVNSVMRGPAREVIMLTFAAGDSDGDPQTSDGTGAAPPASPEEAAIGCGILRQIQELIGEDRFDILTDFFVLEMTHAEIGEKRGKTENAIKVAVCRTLKDIADAFGISRNPAKRRRS